MNESTFEKRTDKVFFQKLAKHRDCFNYILANLVDNSHVYIRELAYNPQSEETYTQWQKRNESISYLFEQDLHKIDDLAKAVKSPQGQHPILFQKYLQKQIILETICILLDATGLIPIWDKRMANDPVWEIEGQKIKKYVPFIKYEKSRIRKLIVAKLKEK